MSEDIIVIDNLVKRFDEKVAVNNLSLKVREGEFFGFLGPNGAGKTTTVRCIATLTNFDEGTVTVAGHDVRKDPVSAKNEHRFWG